MQGELNPKQQRFCLEYLVDFNATQAAIRAGYSKKTASEMSYDLLRKPQVQARIKELGTTIAEKVGVTVERVVAEYCKLAFVNINDFVRIQKADGTAYYDLRNTTPDQMAAIQELIIDEYTEGAKGAKGNGKGATGRDIKRMRLKLCDKKGALDSLGKYLQMFLERHEVTGKDGERLFDFSSFSESELEAIISRARRT